MNDAFFSQQTVDQVSEDILLEIYKAAKIPQAPIFRRLLAPLFTKPIDRFSKFIAKVDAEIGKHGFALAARNALEVLCKKTTSIGEKNIPAKGPLILACNHPGTYDGFLLVSQMPREDFKMIVSGIPFFRNLPNAKNYLIYSTLDTITRMEAIRKSIAHLKNGGALIIYPSGRIDPDPAVFSDADKHLSRWSRSVEIFMNKVPQAKLVLAIASGVLSKDFLNHPFPRLFKNDHEQRRIMEFMQVIRQMIRGKPVELDAKISFSSAITFQDVNDEQKDEKPIVNIQAKTAELLDEHKQIFYPI